MAKLEGNRIVDRARLTGYLLNVAHVTGGPKARFFLSRGFGLEQLDVFEFALSNHPVNNEIVTIEESPWGVKYVIDCHIKTPDGVDPCIRTVWQTDTGADVHRLITAHPNRGGRE